MQIEKNKLAYSGHNIVADKEQKIAELKKNMLNSWEIIAPLWPLHKFIARNPLQGLEKINFTQALEKSFELFQKDWKSKKIEKLNLETIKWCQVLFDQKQAVISLGAQNENSYQTWKKFLRFDSNLHQNEKIKKELINSLSEDPIWAIQQALSLLEIGPEQELDFFHFLLVSLPGWAGYVKFKSQNQKNDKLLSAYLAIRTVIACLMDLGIKDFVAQSDLIAHEKIKIEKSVKEIKDNEQNNYHCLAEALVERVLKINASAAKNKKEIDAQFVFCIDTRSEPLRRNLEAQGNYETFGFPGFFGLPLKIKTQIEHEYVECCPVLLEPKNILPEEQLYTSGRKNILHAVQKIKYSFKTFYLALKYNFIVPCVLAECLGPYFGVYSLIKTIFPVLSLKMAKKVVKKLKIEPSQELCSVKANQKDILGIDFSDQCQYAENFLKMLSITATRAKLFVICGHRSNTQNNHYASALDCGACAGQPGGLNAKILAAILNQEKVRSYLHSRHIDLKDTIFLAAEHDTTNDQIEFLNNITSQEYYSFEHQKIWENLKHNLPKVQEKTLAERCRHLVQENKNVLKLGQNMSANWAETRPEFGLAKNYALIIGPRELTKNLDLAGRVFLNSYDWEKDEQGKILEQIMAGPMMVAQWINSQYLFSTLDNVAYGSGSKITQNITGKFAVMQGNASDLMHGFSLQAVFTTDTEAYHQLARLLTLIYAPQDLVAKLVRSNKKIKQLVENEWIFLAAINPGDEKIYWLDKRLNWQANYENR